VRNGSEARAAMDDELEAWLHLALLNRGVLITPFHNMLLVSPHTHEKHIQTLIEPGPGSGPAQRPDVAFSSLWSHAIQPMLSALRRKNAGRRDAVLDAREAALIRLAHAAAPSADGEADPHRR